MDSSVVHYPCMSPRQHSKIFNRTNSPMIMKLGMEHYELKLYTVYINDDPDLN